MHNYFCNSVPVLLPRRLTTQPIEIQMPAMMAERRILISSFMGAKVQKKYGKFDFIPL
jgi:hypothetical protein